MKFLFVALTFISFSAHAQRGTETVLHCADQTSVSVDVNERRNLIINIGAEIKDQINHTTVGFFFTPDVAPTMTRQMIQFTPIAVIGRAQTGVFYPQQFQGFVAVMKDQKEIRVLKKNDSLQVSLFDGKLNKNVASYTVLNCR